MAPRKGTQAAVSQPVDLQVEETEPSKAVHRMTEKEQNHLMKELGITRRFVHVKDEGRVEIGEGPVFDALLEEDPTGKKAREFFEMVPVVVDLGEQADRIMYDNKIYFHGRTYMIRANQVPNFNETCYNSRRHDAEVNGQAKGLRNTKKNFRMGKTGVATPGN